MCPRFRRTTISMALLRGTGLKRRLPSRWRRRPKANVRLEGRRHPLRMAADLHLHSGHRGMDRRLTTEGLGGRIPLTRLRPGAHIAAASRDWRRVWSWLGWWLGSSHSPWSVFRWHWPRAAPAPRSHDHLLVGSVPIREDHPVPQGDSGDLRAGPESWGRLPAWVQAVSP